MLKHLIFIFMTLAKRHHRSFATWQISLHLVMWRAASANAANRIRIRGVHDTDDWCDRGRVRGFWYLISCRLKKNYEDFRSFAPRTPIFYLLDPLYRKLRTPLRKRFFRSSINLSSIAIQAESGVDPGFQNGGCEELAHKMFWAYVAQFNGLFKDFGTKSCGRAPRLWIRTCHDKCIRRFHVDLYKVLYNNNKSINKFN